MSDLKKEKNMLEIRPYPYAELSQMMGTHDPEGISRRLDRWGVAFTEDGRKPQITYNIEKISDPFKVYLCLTSIMPRRQTLRSWHTFSITFSMTMISRGCRMNVQKC